MPAATPTDIDSLLATYPRRRPPLPPAYRRIYEQEYLLNRHGASFATRLAARAESWMHRTVARNGMAGNILEIGAGTLNHVPYERNWSRYDIVEPFRTLYASSPELPRIGHLYVHVDDIPLNQRYDRVLSIAVLEHLEDLPAVVARCALLVEDGGLTQHAIPSEGGALWGLGWRLTTGIGYRLRNGLSYSVAMRHEHINAAPEIVRILRWFYDSVQLRRFPLAPHHLSLYTYVEARAPRRDRCETYLQARSA